MPQLRMKAGTALNPLHRRFTFLFTCINWTLRLANGSIGTLINNATCKNAVPANDFISPDNPPFVLSRPAMQRVPYVFNSPHSGRIYPTSLVEASRLTELALRQSEDGWVDELFASVVEIGAPLFSARFPRAWLDVNREPYELDPLLYDERLPGHANIRSLRVAGGLGTIPRLVAEDQAIYKSAPDLSGSLWRIENIYRPYHEVLRKLIGHTVTNFGYAVLVDCHSMPSKGGRKEMNDRPDIIIGDRYGTACNNEISLELANRFEQLGYSVARNKPYAGGFITEHYGRPQKGLHAVQIEINRGLYMNEDTMEKKPGFSRLSADISKVVNHLVALPDKNFSPSSLAAE